MSTIRIFFASRRKGKERDIDGMERKTKERRFSANKAYSMNENYIKLEIVLRLIQTS